MDNNYKSKELFGENVGRERIWSMTDKAYDKQYGINNQNELKAENMETAISYSEEIQHNLNKTHVFMSGEDVNNPLFKEMMELLTELKTKSELFLEDSKKNFMDRKTV